ncbi:hypothetical protein BN946_scf184940.g76 [Trametes cinnabarina]|uniref:Cleavage/polyadenylation specificity factor A subunit N-terminal domain-containing protein n=1 Tax=Pycnoporus cinnabarinus TaxID=5643 RepID=A0A060SI84_PYCCI|nr:hypothetical protein BN946_scf184940.g76 [Trametes cinnabarina]
MFALHRFMNDRSLWHHALSRLLGIFPQPYLSRRLQELTADELKAYVIHSAKLDTRWHRVDYRPREVRNFQCDSTVEHVNLVAGGSWVVVVLYNGTLQLQELGAPCPAVTLSHCLTEEESVFYLSSRLSFSDDHEDLVILQMGVRQCNIYVYHVSVVDPMPAFRLVGKISVTGFIWCCEMVLHVCAIDTDNPEPQRPQVSMNIGSWSADEDFSISVLSEHQLLLTHHGGLSLYEIPSASPDATQARRVRPAWSKRCDIGSGIYRISSFSWDAHRHPVVVIGTHALHVLRPGNSGEGADVDYREIPYPLSPGTRLGYMGLGSVGLRRAIWDCTEARNGALHVHFCTYSLPRSILGLHEDDPDFGREGIGVSGRIGSFMVALDPEEHLVNLCLEESSGRVCLLLNNIVTGARRISVIDAV